MKITFKDVGQGDSIILEWVDAAGVRKIGIIDCNLKGKSNPVIKHIEDNKYGRIEFVILSHPHEDHYSGLLELLEYIQRTGKVIVRMGHTLGFSGVENYWKYFEVATRHTNLLSAIKSKWFSMLKSGHIGRMDFLTDGKVMQIDKELSVTVIAPSHQDIRLYMQNVRLDEVTHPKEASRAANLLSTLLRINHKGYNYLLTSDTEVIVFLNALQNEPQHFKGVSFHLCQMAHHGSVRNYAPGFWDQIENFEIQNAIASAGNGYRHPSIKVLKAFDAKGYKVYCTNIVNGMVTYTAELERKHRALDPFSSPAEEYKNSGDRVFAILEGQVQLVR